MSSHVESVLRSRWLTVSVSLALITLSGYVTFIIFIREFVPNAASISLLLFALVAGVATFFSPCSFPLLPGYLAHYLSASRTNRIRDLLNTGMLAGLGVLSFNLALGVTIAAVGASVAQSLAISTPSPSNLVLLFRGLVGMLLIGLGAMNLRGSQLFHSRFFREIAQRLRGATKANRNPSIFAYSFAYVSVGIGCAGPILAGLSVLAISFGGFYSAILAFLVYSLTMTLLMTGVSISAGLAREASLERLVEISPKIKRTGSFVQMFVGLFLVFATVFNEIFVGLLFPR